MPSKNLKLCSQLQVYNFYLEGKLKMLGDRRGPVAKSKVFKQFMAYLNVEILTHMPDDADGRKKLLVPKVKSKDPFVQLKILWSLFIIKDLSEANEWLCHYLEHYNQEKHRKENHSRLEDWRINLPPRRFSCYV